MRLNGFGQPVGEAVAFQSPPVPGGEELRGRFVTLRPLAVDDAPELLASVQTGAGDEQWTYLSVEPCHDEAAMRAVVEQLLAAPDRVPYALVVGGRVAGTASLMRIDPAAGSIEVGWILLGDGLRRAAAATEAIHLLARHVFDLGYRRFEWKCDFLNAPSCRAAERLGFTFEGVFRNALVYKGRNRDTAWFAITVQDWPAIRQGSDRWLDPANFDAAGRQRRTLEAVRRNPVS